MKLLWFTDSHIRANNPEERIDKYEDSIYQKFQEIYEIAKIEKVDHIIFGGDLFDGSDISKRCAKRFINLIESQKILCHVCYGNHDQKNGIIEGTLLDYTVEYTKKLRHLNTLTLNDCFIQGYDYHYDIESQIKTEGLIHSQSEGIYTIAVVHANLLPKAGHPKMAFAVYDEISTNYDLVLIGHYHLEANPVTIGKTTFYNTGSIARLSKSIGDRKRIPSVLIIDTDTRTTKTIALQKFLPEDKVFDLVKIAQTQTREAELDKVITNINAVEFKTLDLRERVKTVCESEIASPELVKDLLGRIKAE